MQVLKKEMQDAILWMFKLSGTPVSHSGSSTLRPSLILDPLIR